MIHFRTIRFCNLSIVFAPLVRSSINHTNTKLICQSSIMLKNGMARHITGICDFGSIFPLHLNARLCIYKKAFSLSVKDFKYMLIVVSVTKIRPWFEREYGHKYMPMICYKQIHR